MRPPGPALPRPHQTRSRLAAYPVRCLWATSAPAPLCRRGSARPKGSSAALGPAASQGSPGCGARAGPRVRLNPVPCEPSNRTRPGLTPPSVSQCPDLRASEPADPLGQTPSWPPGPWVPKPCPSCPRHPSCPLHPSPRPPEPQGPQTGSGSRRRRCGRLLTGTGRPRTRGRGECTQPVASHTASRSPVPPGVVQEPPGPTLPAAATGQGPKPERPRCSLGPRHPRRPGPRAGPCRRCRRRGRRPRIPRRPGVPQAASAQPRGDAPRARAPRLQPRPGRVGPGTRRPGARPGCSGPGPGPGLASGPLRPQLWPRSFSNSSDILTPRPFLPDVWVPNRR